MTRIYECQALMSNNQKNDIEKALEIQSEIIKEQGDYIPAIYVSTFNTLGNGCWILAFKGSETRY
jgi:hypothetical protein